MSDNAVSRPDHPRDGDDEAAVTVGVPRLSRDHLSRPRLLRTLDADVPLRVVHAPAGYGKTSLLAEWAWHRRAARENTVWVTVDGDCDTRPAFWAHVVALLNATGLARGSDFDRAEITGDVVATLPVVLMRGVDSLRRPLTLVVDAYENLADPAVETDLLRLVRHTTNLSLVVGTRAATALAATETTLALDVVVVDGRDLALTADEVTLLASHVDNSLTPEQVAALHEASGGWPLAVRAGVRSPRENPWPAPDEDDPVSRVQRMLVEDLVGLPGFDDLVALSVVDGFTAEQAKLLGTDVMGAPILAEVESRGLGSWETGASSSEPRFRLQPLIRHALYARLDPATLRRAHRELTSWYEDHDEYGRAFESAMIARDWARAHRFLTTALHKVALGLDPTWAQRVEVTRSVLRDYPVLGVMVALEHYRRGDVGRAVRTLSSSVAHVEWRRLSALGQVSVDHLWIQGIFALGLRFAGRDELVQPALRRLYGMLPRATGPQEELTYFRLILANQAASTYVLLDRPDDALRAMADRPLGHESAGNHTRSSESVRVLVHASAGRIAQARELLAEFVEPDLPRYFNAGFHAVPKHVGAAYVHLEDHRPDAADEELAQVRPHWPTVEWWPLVLHVRALQRWHAAGPLSGLRALEAGLAEKRTKPLGAAMRAMLTALHAELLLAAGRPAEARRLLPSRRVGPYPRLAVAKARSLLMEGELARALALATGPEHEHRTTPRIRLDLRLIAASSRLRAGDRATAVRDFEDAVALAVGTGLRSPFAAMPRGDFIELAGAVPGVDELRDHVGGFAELFPEPEEQIALTRRELVVLTELASPDSLPVIAARLSVATATVKTQCRAVYRKLGVPGRQQAVAEARRRGIL